MKLTGQQNLRVHIGRGLAIPHEALHIAGYRLVGKRCRYCWGDSYVTPIGPMTRRERLVGLLFPCGVFTFLVVAFGLLSTFAYGSVLRGGSPFWFILWTVLVFIAGGYAGTTIGDLRKAYLLIMNKPWHSRTPFDLFFWPMVDWAEVRKKVEASRKNDAKN